METWYEADSYWRPGITEVQVSASTEHTVTVGGRKRMKRANTTAIFPTASEAVAFLREAVGYRLGAAQSEVDRAREFARQVSEIADKYKV